MIESRKAKPCKVFPKEEKMKKWWNDTYADYPEVGKIYDADVGEFAFKHLRLRDRLNPRKVGAAVITSQEIFMKIVREDELPRKKNWKFFRDF